MIYTLSAIFTVRLTVHHTLFLGYMIMKNLASAQITQEILRFTENDLKA